MPRLETTLSVTEFALSVLSFLNNFSVWCRSVVSYRDMRLLLLYEKVVMFLNGYFPK